MDLEDGNKGSKLSDIDGSGETKQSEAPVRVSDGTGEIEQPQTPVEALDGTGEIKQPETPVEVPDGTGKSKPPKTPDETEEIKKSETAPQVTSKSEESTQSKTPPKVNDVSGVINQSETPTEVSYSGEDTQQEVPPKVNHGSGGNNHLYSPPQVVESTTNRGHQSPSGTLSEDNSEGGACKQPSSPPLPSKIVETTATGCHTREPSDRLLSFTSSSSSGSDTSLDDLFQVESSRFSTTLTHHPPLPHGQGSRTSTSRVSNGSNGLPKESPPAIQMMDRYEGYDPSRIPSSVFDTSNNKEMEWSVASNDSLFSLHLGNNSFSRDHIGMLNDLGSARSGELFRISAQTPPPVVEETNGVEVGREYSAEELADVNIKDKEHPSTTENRSEGKVRRLTFNGTKSPSLGCSPRSDESGYSAASAFSFAFPILTDETKNSLKLPQDSELKHLQEPSPASMPRKSSKKKSRWVPSFSWCKGGCGGCSCRQFCSCSSCSSCFRRTCSC